jgi:hypothetical protein
MREEIRQSMYAGINRTIGAGVGSPCNRVTVGVLSDDPLCCVNSNC